MQNMMDELLAKYLLNEATGAEQAEVEQWIATGEENKRYYEHFKLMLERSRKLAEANMVDENEAWERFLQKAEPAADTATAVIPVRRKPLSWVRVAAILLVLVMCGGLIYYFKNAGGPKMIALQSGDHVLIDTLSDGSVVTINKHAIFSYPESFKGDTRRVRLEGEAFFNVAPDKSKPFIIDANGTQVKVVGTSFNVKTNSQKTEVIVETGVVEVSKKKKAVKLNPHERATVSGDGPIKEANDDELYSYYKNNEFICEHTPLSRLVDALNDAYGVRIVVTGDAGSRQITTTFKNKSLDEILTIVAETLKVRIEKNGNEILIK